VIFLDVYGGGGVGAYSTGGGGSTVELWLSRGRGEGPLRRYVISMDV